MKRLTQILLMVAFATSAVAAFGHAVITRINNVTLDITVQDLLGSNQNEVLIDLGATAAIVAGGSASLAMNPGALPVNDPITITAA